MDVYLEDGFDIAQLVPGFRPPLSSTSATALPADGAALDAADAGMRPAFSELKNIRLRDMRRPSKVRKGSCPDRRAIVSAACASGISGATGRRTRGARRPASAAISPSSSRRLKHW